MIDQAELREILGTCLDEEELQTFCFERNVEYEHLPGKGKAGKVRALVAYCERHRRFLELLLACYRWRPQVFRQRAVGLPLETPQLAPLNLLKRLESPAHHRAADILRLCREVEALLEQERFVDAIKAARSAVARSRRAHHHSLTGITLLYSSLARWSSRLPQETLRAAPDCDAALTHFCRQGHNGAIALIFRAQLDRQMGEWHDSLVFLEEARRELLKLKEDCWQRGGLKLDKARMYEDLLDGIRTIGLQALVSIPPDQIEATGAPPPMVFDDPTLLVWPASGQATSFSVSRSSRSESDPAVQKPGARVDETDYVEVSQVSINGKLYAVRPLSTSSGSARPVRLRRSMKYRPFQVYPDQSRHGDTYILMRIQSKPDRSDQRIVAYNATRKRIWIVGRPPPRVLGQPEKQTWRFPFRDEAGNIGSETGQIHGVVEALLTPIQPDRAQGERS